MPRSFFVCVLVVLFAAFMFGDQRATHASDASTGVSAGKVIYLIRHAEKIDGGGQDPPLSSVGAARAARLAEMLTDEPLAAVYVTPTRRSRDTGRPTAQANGIPLTEYAPLDTDAVIRQICELPAGSRCLVVAHSNTVPSLLHGLGGPEIADLTEMEFDRFFAIVLNPEAESRVLHLRY